MNYKIEGSILPILTISLNEGESIYSRTGTLIQMDESIEMSTELMGGLLKGIRRTAGKEAMFLTKFTGLNDGAKLQLAGMDVPGNTKAFKVNFENDLLVERAAFLASESSVDLDIAFMKRISAGLLGGEGFIFLHFTGEGTIFLHPYGEISEHVLKEGEKTFVARGKIVAFEKSMDFNVRFMKTIKNTLLSRDGMFLCELTGPGRVWTQSSFKIGERLR